MNQLINQILMIVNSIPNFIWILIAVFLVVMIIIGIVILISIVKFIKKIKRIGIINIIKKKIKVHQS